MKFSLLQAHKAVQNDSLTSQMEKCCNYGIAGQPRPAFVNAAKQASHKVNMPSA